MKLSYQFCLLILAFSLFSIPIKGSQKLEESSEYPMVLELGHPNDVMIENIRWSSDGHAIAASLNRTTCVIFNASTGKKVDSLSLNAPISALEWAGTDLIFAYNGNIIRRTKDGFKRIDTHLWPISHLAWSATKKILVAHCHSWNNDDAQSFLYTLNTENEEYRRHFLVPSNTENPRIGNPSCITWSPCGNYLALTTGKNERNYGWERVFLPEGLGFRSDDFTSPPPTTLCIFDFTQVADDLKPTLIFKTTIESTARSLVWSKDGCLLALLFDTGAIKLYDTKKKKCTFEVPAPESEPIATELALSSDSRYLTFGAEEELKIFDLIKHRYVPFPPFACLSPTLTELARQKGIVLNAHHSFNARKIAWSPLLPLVAVALKESENFFSHALVLFDLHMLYSSHKDRRQRELHGKSILRKQSPLFL